MIILHRYQFFKPVESCSQAAKGTFCGPKLKGAGGGKEYMTFYGLKKRYALRGWERLPHTVNGKYNLC